MTNRKLLRTGVRGMTGLGLMAALTLAAPTGIATTAAAADGGSAADCVDVHGHSNARVAEGTDAAADPNTVTEAEAEAFNKQLEERVDELRGADNKLPAGKVKIKTYVHVITKKDGTGKVSKKLIKKQMSVINDGFGGKTSKKAAGGKFRFVIKKIDVTKNNKWYDWKLVNDQETPTIIQAKKKLHKGTKKDLNIYIAGLQDGLLGYATFPGGPVKRDGLVILNESMPGGDSAPYNKGDTATHEIGHWMGLFHTFQGGCADEDKVKDTPAQNDGNNIFKCKTKLNTCSSPGKDPVHNFMNYSNDKCMNMFTKGQQQRMNKVWKNFRA